jgi:hypothetical protein
MKGKNLERNHRKGTGEFHRLMQRKGEIESKHCEDLFGGFGMFGRVEKPVG